MYIRVDKDGKRVMTIIPDEAAGDVDVTDMIHIDGPIPDFTPPSEMKVVEGYWYDETTKTVSATYMDRQLTDQEKISILEAKIAEQNGMIAELSIFIGTLTTGGN